jgi:hypothetical protein
MVDAPDGAEGRCEGAVDEGGNLERVDCIPDNFQARHLDGNVSRIELHNTGGGNLHGAAFVDKNLAQRIKAEAER